MTSTTAVPVTAGSATLTRRLAPLSGLGVLIAFVVGISLQSIPDGNQSDAKWEHFIAQSSTRLHLELFSVLCVVAAALLLVFFSDLSARLRTPSPLGLVLASSAAVVLAIGGAVVASAAWYKGVDGGPLPSAQLVRFAQGLGWPLLGVCAFPLLGAAIAVMSKAAGDAGLLGRKTVVFGYVAAVLSLASFVFFPMAFALLWLAIAGVQLSRQ